MTKETYDISVGQLYRAQERVEQLGRRARKLSLSGNLGIEVVREYTRNITSEITGETIRREKRYEVSVVGQAPCLAGYTFLGTIEHLEEGNVVRQVPGVLQEGALESYRTGAPQCDHCQKNRRRKDTFLLREDKTGRIFQVGSTCLVDFAGEGADLAGKLVVLLGLLRDFCRGLGSEDDEDRLGSSGERLLDLEYYLSFVAAAIRTQGWVSRTKAREQDARATADYAADCLKDSEKCREITCHNRWHNHVERTEKDSQEAKLAVTFVESLEDVQNKSDYLHNLYVACASGAISQRHLGIAASAIIARQSRDAKRQEKTSQFLDAYLPGKVGEKIQKLEVTLLDVKSFDGQYGVSHLHRFVAKGGYRVSWFASSEQSFEVGKTYLVNLKIKRFEDKYGKTALVTHVAAAR